MEKVIILHVFYIHVKLLSFSIFLILLVSYILLFSNKKYYKISSFSIYINKEAIVIAGKTKPINGTKIEGKYEAVIIKTPSK